MSDGDMLDGWGAIARALSVAAEVPVSTDQAKRYAKSHGLPVKRIGPGARKRVKADPCALADWCIKAFG